MFTLIVWYGVLLVVGLGFGVAPFFGSLRTFPRWIRIALLMTGLSLIAGTALGFVLHSTAARFPAGLYRFLYAHEMLIFGMGIGIILLLIFSGEIFKALLKIDTARRSRKNTE